MRRGGVGTGLHRNWSRAAEDLGAGKSRFYSRLDVVEFPRPADKHGYARVPRVIRSGDRRLQGAARGHSWRARGGVGRPLEIEPRKGDQCGSKATESVNRTSGEMESHQKSQHHAFRKSQHPPARPCKYLI